MKMKTKKCTRCKKRFPISKFSKDKYQTSGFRCWCKKCSWNSSKGWRETHKENIRANDRIYKIRTKELVMTHYGGNPPKCACCGETEIGFLTIDHINGGGTKHRREIGRQLYQWLKMKKLPEGYQVLCYNCNCAKGKLGECPHRTKNKSLFT